jgi:hypothetical protein
VITYEKGEEEEKSTYPMHIENVMNMDALMVNIKKLLNNLSLRSYMEMLLVLEVVASLRVDSKTAFSGGAEPAAAPRRCPALPS